MRATQNDGRITSQTDGISGEQVVYTYDAVNRLASAARKQEKSKESNQVSNFIRAARRLGQDSSPV